MEQESNTKLNKALSDIRNIKMTPLEKELMLRNIFTISPFFERPVKSPYSFPSSFFVKLKQRQFVYIAAALSLVFVLSGGTVFASEKSLPGSIFYPIKTKVVEPARGALIFSSEAKVLYQRELSVKRMVEAETLAQADKLDSDKEDELNRLLESHTTAFNSAVLKYKQNSNDNEDNLNSDEDIVNFQGALNAHAEALDSIIQRKNKKDNVEGNEENRISRTAREKAVKARDNLKDKNKDVPILELK